MPVIIGGSGINFSASPTEVTLAGAQAYTIPSGQYLVQLGMYTIIEWYDSNLGFWRNWSAIPGRMHSLVSDGTNFRLINRTGCPVGAIMTNMGSGYTSAPTVTVSAGGSKWHAIVGGAINTTVTTTTAGVYNYIPTLVFSPPPAGGITATGTVALSGAGLGTVTVTNRGAGYTSAPTITIVPDPRETGSQGGVLTVNATLAGSGVVTATICDDPGNAVQTTLPTLTYSGGGGTNAAATVIMNWTVTGITVGTPGTGYGTSLPFKVTGNGLLNASTDAAGDVNPAHNLGLTLPRNCWFSGTSTAGGAATATGLVTDDAGWGIQRVPDLVILTGQLITGAAAATASVGATTDTSFLQLLKL